MASSATVVANQGDQRLIYGVRYSSVVPAGISGEDKIHELTSMDLAMKLHYIRGLYFFSGKAGKDIRIHDFKEASFYFLANCFLSCGRIRMSESGRPCLKLNDAGVRIVEARSSKTVDEWLQEMMNKNDHACKSYELLVGDNPLGPDLGFTPLVFLQFTWFKCGGLSVGLSWAHVLGDVFAATAYMNMFGQFMQGYRPTKPLKIPADSKAAVEYPLDLDNQEPVSIKRVDPVGDHWIIPANDNKKLGTHTFQLNSEQIGGLYSSIDHQESARKLGSFEVISAMLWKSIAKIKENSDHEVEINDEPRTVTICRPNRSIARDKMSPCNRQVISTVDFGTDEKVSEAGLLKLVTSFMGIDGHEKKVQVENGIIERIVEQEVGKSDFILYGAKLTFVDMEDADIYGFKLNGECPVFADMIIDGVAEQGAVLIFPAGPRNDNDQGGIQNEACKVVKVTLPEDELHRLKAELKQEWLQVV